MDQLGVSYFMTLGANYLNRPLLGRHTVTNGRAVTPDLARSSLPYQQHTRVFVYFAVYQIVYLTFYLTRKKCKERDWTVRLHPSFCLEWLLIPLVLG